MPAPTPNLSPKPLGSAPRVMKLEPFCGTCRVGHQTDAVAVVQPRSEVEVVAQIRKATVTP